MIKYENQTRCPMDRETILISEEYVRTKIKPVKGATVYKREKYYYHIDTFHKGNGAHLEVYNKRGEHIGEADIYTGEIIPNTRDKKKKLYLN